MSTNLKCFSQILQSLDGESLVVIYSNENHHYDTPVKASQLLKKINGESQDNTPMILTYHDTNYDDQIIKPIGVYLTSNNIRDRQKFAVNTSRIIMINSIQGLKRMTNQYSVNGKISWKKVSEQYYGIYITNLKNKHKAIPSLSWYYDSWPSGIECCIWNLNCIVKKLDKSNA